MYNSPIELLVTDIQNQIVKQQDEEIYQAVLHYEPNVDKGELLRALEYDRGQYEKGYADGKADAMNEIVRCKDCKHWECWRISGEGSGNCLLDYYGLLWNGNDFCSYGERRSDD